MPKGRHPTIDKFGIARQEEVGFQSNLRGNPGTKIVEKHVGLFDELIQTLHVRGVFEVDHDRAFVAVHIVKGQGGLLDKRRPPSPGVISSFRALDLDHVCAEIGHNSPCQGAG